MLGLNDLKHTRVYQEAFMEGKMETFMEDKIEGKLECVPFILTLGATVEQIAEALGLDIEQVRKASKNTQSHNS